MINPAPTQHILDHTEEIKKPETTVISGSKMVEAAGVEPASENNQSRLLHAYPKLYN